MYAFLDHRRLPPSKLSGRKFQIPAQKDPMREILSDNRSAADAEDVLECGYYVHGT
jgi:hypothetical protein